MNTVAIVFSALLVAVAANSVHRNSGWGAPALPSINLDLVGALAINGQGAANAAQALAEHAVGDAHVPASIVSSNGISASGIQDGSILQVETADLLNGNTDTLQTVEAAQDIVALDTVVADLAGAALAEAAVSANTAADGSGDLEIAAVSVNDVVRP